MNRRRGREEHPKRNRQYIALLLILSLFLIVFLSGCLGSEKKNDTQNVEDYTNVSKNIDLAFESLLRAVEFRDEAYVAEGEKDYETAIKLFEEAKKSYEKSHNHFSAVLNKTGDPTLDDLVFYFAEATKFYAKAYEVVIKKTEYLSRGDIENFEKARDEARKIYRRGQEFDDKAEEILKEMKSQGRKSI